jgi:hypothetical protein
MVITYLCCMLLRRTAALLLIMLILFADNGQMIYARTCFKSNNTSFSIFKPSACLAENASRSCCHKKVTAGKNAWRLGKKSCCSVSGKFVKLSFPTNTLSVQTIAVNKDVIVHLSTLQSFASLGNSPQPVACNGPPLPPTALRALIQVFRC